MLLYRNCHESDFFIQLSELILYVFFKIAFTTWGSIVFMAESRSVQETLLHKVSSKLFHNYFRNSRWSSKHWDSFICDCRYSAKDYFPFLCVLAIFK